MSPQYQLEMPVTEVVLGTLKDENGRKAYQGSAFNCFTDAVVNSVETQALTDITLLISVCVEFLISIQLVVDRQRVG